MTGKNHQFTTGWWLSASAVLVMSVVVLSRAPMRGSSDETLVGKPRAPIRITAEWSQEWQEDNGTIALFRGLCRIQQGSATYSADSMVIWTHESEESPEVVERLTVYLEGDVRIEDANSSRTDQSSWLELDASRGVSASVRGRATDRPGRDDPLFKRAVQRRSGPTRAKLRQTQLTVPSTNTSDSDWRAVPVQTPLSGIRNIRVSPRSLSSPYSISSQLSTDTNPPEQVTLITGGVNILVEGISAPEGMTVPGQVDFGAIDLSADRVVIWTDDFHPEQQQLAEQKYQVYLEGHIVIRQRDNVRKLSNTIRAERAFFDVRDHRALVLEAELETYISQLDTSVRMRADRIRQNSEKNFHLQNAWITTSQYGVPGYRFQSSDIFFVNRDTGLLANNGPPKVDPQTGIVIPEDHYWVTALNSQFLVDQFPIFNTPRVSVPVEQMNSSTPLQGGNVGLDRIFGTQVKASWNVFSILGVDQPANTRLSLLTEYFSKRGPGVGINGTYNGADTNGNTYFGTLFGNYNNDHGRDNLGFDRRDLIPPSDNRGLFQWENRYNLDEYNGKLFGEFGFDSDRNYLEEFYERRFDTGKDIETKAQWNQNLDDNVAYTILGRTQLFNFENNTQWLPRGDLYALGEPLLNNFVNYSSHSSIGYGVMNPASPPTDPTEVFTPLPYMTQANGLVTQTRHEFDAPFSLGGMKISPFVMGEAAYWGEGLADNGPVSRLYGRAGIRATISAQRIFPMVQSEIFNLNGLAHKSVFDVEYSLSGSTQSLNNIAQWNEIDDNAQERFRMRLVQDTFGGVLPAQFDPRFYAVRTGAGATVTAPYNELVANQEVFRLNWNQRLQTKVGPPDLPRIKDWMTLDLGASIFPNANRDNFGQTVGLVNSRYVWHVGDRTSILASSMYDFFSEGQQLWSVGVMNQRSLRGSVYMGLRQVKGGTLDSQILTASYTYVMSPKWVSTATTAFDIAQARSAGQGFTLTRVGEWLLIHLGGNVDVSKNNVGMMISIEPRIGRGTISSTQLGSLAGAAAQQPY